MEENYRMSQGKKGRQPNHKQGDWLKFRDYAQVTEKFLSEFEAHYEPPIFTPKELKGLLVFAELSEGVWFMPCLMNWCHQSTSNSTESASWELWPCTSPTAVP